jgi:hypothetical protein
MIKPPTPSAFTVQINSLMKDHAARCPYAYRALALYAAFGTCAEYLNARQNFANAYAARANRDFRRFMITLALMQLATFAALYYSLRA